MRTLMGTDELAEAAKKVRGGSVVLVPTDTVYGLAVHPSAHDAVEKVFRMKGRPPQKHLPVMVPDVNSLVDLGVDVNSAADRLIGAGLFPGPLTIAFGFDSAKARPGWLEGRIEVAVRIPKNDILRRLLRLTGPLLVTSANASGEPTKEDTASILRSLHVEPDYVLEGGHLSAVPSTLVNCRLVPPIVEREGEVSANYVQAVLGGE